MSGTQYLGPEMFVVGVIEHDGCFDRVMAEFAGRHWKRHELHPQIAHPAVLG